MGRKYVRKALMDNTISMKPEYGSKAHELFDKAVDELDYVSFRKSVLYSVTF
jgi:phage baseplate assembly protein W